MVENYFFGVVPTGYRKSLCYAVLLNKLEALNSCSYSTDRFKDDQICLQYSYNSIKLLFRPHGPEERLNIFN